MGSARETNVDPDDMSLGAERKPLLEGFGSYSQAGMAINDESMGKPRKSTKVKKSLQQATNQLEEESCF